MGGSHRPSKLARRSSCRSVLRLLVWASAHAPRPPLAALMPSPHEWGPWGCRRPPPPFVLGCEILCSALSRRLPRACREQLWKLRSCARCAQEPSIALGSVICRDDSGAQGGHIRVTGSSSRRTQSRVRRGRKHEVKSGADRPPARTCFAAPVTVTVCAGLARGGARAGPVAQASAAGDGRRAFTRSPAHVPLHGLPALPEGLAQEKRRSHSIFRAQCPEASLEDLFPETSPCTDLYGTCQGGAAPASDVILSTHPPPHVCLHTYLLGYTATSTSLYFAQLFYNFVILSCDSLRSLFLTRLCKLESKNFYPFSSVTIISLVLVGT